MPSMKLVQILNSTDEITKKFIHETTDGHYIEGTYVNYSNKHIVCFSTQIGCAGQCIFCANGLANNFHRNLTALEMFEQCHGILSEITDEHTFMGGKPILFSAMGCGDPVLNSAEVFNTFKALYALYPFSKFALATAGSKSKRLKPLLADIDRENLPFKLTISLHAANDDKRKMLLPNAAPLDSLMPDVLPIHKFGVGRTYSVDYNVVLFDEINDSDDDATAICNLFHEYGITATANVKINKYNPVTGSILQPSTREEAFIARLQYLGIQVESYETNGADVGAACGQLVNR